MVYIYRQWHYILELVMAHFAKLDDNNIVTDVVVVHNNELLDSQGIEREELGVAFLIRTFGYGNWKQTSYNENFRKNYAGIGHKYDSQRDAYIPPQTFPSWILDEATCTWEPPIPIPDDYMVTKLYIWDESIVNWKDVSDGSPPPQ